MAKAEKKLIPVPPAQQPFEVMLTLNEQEAQTLADILAKVGGVPETTRRRHASAIAGALEEAGVRFHYTQFSCGAPDLHVQGNGLWFEEEK